MQVKKRISKLLHYYSHDSDLNFLCQDIIHGRTKYIFFFREIKEKFPDLNVGQIEWESFLDGLSKEWACFDYHDIRFYDAGRTLS